MTGVGRLRALAALLTVAAALAACDAILSIDEYGPGAGSGPDAAAAESDGTVEAQADAPKTTADAPATPDSPLEAAADATDDHVADASATDAADATVDSSGGDGAGAEAHEASDAPSDGALDATVDAPTEASFDAPPEAPTCIAPEIDCGGTCVNPSSSQQYCGATGNCLGPNVGSTCPGGQACSSSLCCPSAQINCQGTCIDPATSNAYCGATAGCGAGSGSAGQACASGFLCSNDTCQLTCATGLVDCAGSCINPQTSNTNCGATAGCGAGSGSAGAVCPSGTLCSNDTCQVTCPTGQVVCSGACINPQTNNAYCGATTGCGQSGGSAGAACTSGFTCVNEVCTPVCASGSIECDGTCINPLTSNTYCGASGNCTGINAGTTCPSGDVCSNGSCALSCQTGYVDCSNQCIDPQSSNVYCGAAPGGQCNSATPGNANYEGVSCSAVLAGSSCSGGNCHCPSGYATCAAGTACTNPQTSNTYCGAAPGGMCNSSTLGSANYEGANCAVIAGSSCSGGICSCPTGQLNCSGKCVDPQTNSTYCGAIGNCAGANAGVNCTSIGKTCSSGVCK